MRGSAYSNSKKRRLCHSRFKNLLAAMLSISATAVHATDADTLVWYRFSDLPEVGTVDYGVFLTNEVGSSFKGVADSLDTASATWKHGGWVVGGTNDWPSTVSLLDGMNALANDRCVHFREGKGTGVIRIDDEQGENNAWRLANGSFTVELFVKTREMKPQTLVCRGIGESSFENWDTNDCWRLELVRRSENDGGYLVLTSKGGGASVRTTGTRNGPSLSDGKWHHVAVTYDSTTRTWQVFQDYQILGSLALPEGEAPNLAGRPVIIGCVPQRVWANFKNGSLDEFRVTGRVLTAREFLGYRAVAHDQEDDVAVYLPFDEPSAVGADEFPCARGWESATGTSLSWNAVHPARAAEITFYDGATGNLESDDMPGSRMYATVLSPADYANGGALVLSGKENETAARILISDASEAMGENYTVEVFFKAESGSSTRNVGLLVAEGCWNVQVLEGGYLNCTDASYKRWVEPTPQIVDGKWHHLACVYDKTAKSISFYLDYLLVGRGSGVDLSAAKNLYLAASQYGTGFTDMKLDAFRLTRKALKPSEFLTTKRVEGATLVWAPFDTTTDLLAAYVETPVFTGEAAVVRPCAGQLLDADKHPLSERPENKGSLSLAEGAAAYSRLSLLERPDQTVEFFVRGKASADTDLIALLGVKGTETNTVWALRQTGDGLKVVVGGDTTVSAGSLGSDWSHVGIVFAPSADNAKTTVTVYRDYKVVEAKEVDGLLSVDNLSDSVLSFGQFDGNLDELRVSRGSLGVKDFLRARRPGFALIVR